MQIIKKIQAQTISAWFLSALFLLSMPLTVWANIPAMTGMKVLSSVGEQVQIQLDMNVSAMSPKVFKMAKPARLVLDFTAKNQLDQKKFIVQQGVVKDIYVVAASGTTRVVIHLAKPVLHNIQVKGQQVFIILKPINTASTSQSSLRVGNTSKVTNLLAAQTIKKIDFRRGLKGEGRLLLELSTENIALDIKESTGKVELNFLHTTLPAALIKTYDVVDFATPVHKIDARLKGADAQITITVADTNYSYSSFQSDGLLTVDFLPLTATEKAVLEKKKSAYTGEKLSFNFQGIKVRNALHILSEFTGLNIIASDTVEGEVSLRLNNVPWDQVLDLILKTNNLAKRTMDNVILVAPAAEIIKIEKEELAANKIIEQLKPLRTEYIKINYAKAKDIQLLLVGSQMLSASSESISKKSISLDLVDNKTTQSSHTNRSNKIKGVLSLRGTCVVDERTNTLIVKETAKQLEEIRHMIKMLDVPVKQVMIEARIVIADINFARDIGVKFGVARTNQIKNGNGKFFSTTSPIPYNNLLVDLGAQAINANSAGAMGMTLARAANRVLNLELSALQNDGRGEILANPRVMTSNGELAYIRQGVQIAFVTVSEDGTETELIDAVLELNVTPQITPDGDVIMKLLIKNDAPATGGIAGIDKREVNTIVRVRDGETIVLGGVYDGAERKEVFKIPFFGDLPNVGFLFRRDNKTTIKRELLIFVTPKILKDNLVIG